MQEIYGVVDQQSDFSLKSLVNDYVVWSLFLDLSSVSSFWFNNARRINHLLVKGHDFLTLTSSPPKLFDILDIRIWNLINKTCLYDS